MDTTNYLEKVYAGFLGMNIGIRLGAALEPAVWTYERIRDTYGDIRDYVRDYKKFAADDDVNGPVYFLRALRDDAAHRRVTARDVARAWLNYTREGVGMFWWGGYGVSTEHTAYLNLKNGIPAPESGSERQNGKVMAEQIGGQIFIDTWGLLYPGDPQKAADDAQAAASVSHDGEGLYGARFIAACIACAFTQNRIEDVIEAGLAQIPEESRYRAVAEAVKAFHREHPDNWRDCYQMLVREWGYDRYPGVCHIIPNAGVCVLAMLYGQGDFARTIEIAVMCSWDTDCNAGNVGTILGVMAGPEGIPGHYRGPINDSLILSGISGYLNILDAPSYAKEVAALGMDAQGEGVPAQWNLPKDGTLWFDFELPRSTHGFQVSDSYFCSMEHSTEHACSGKGSLKILMNRMVRGNTCKVFYKPFYSRDAFSDERYSPVLTPQVYSGQRVSMQLYLDQWDGWEETDVAPYVRTAFDKKEWIGGAVKLVQNEWKRLEFTVPDTQGALIDEVGFVLQPNTPSKSRTTGCVYLDDFCVDSAQNYRICFAKQKKEFGTVTPFSADHGAWEVAEGKLSLMCCGEAFAYAGNYYAADCSVSSGVLALNGSSQLLLIRAQGAMRFYAAGFEGGDIVIYKNNFGFETLCRREFSRKEGREYLLTLKAAGEKLTLSVDGEKLLEAEDSDFAYGMYGCGSRSMGRTLFGDFAVQVENTSGT